jgi:hypothetical protein
MTHRMPHEVKDKGEVNQLVLEEKSREEVKQSNQAVSAKLHNLLLHNQVHNKLPQLKLVLPNLI